MRERTLRTAADAALVFTAWSIPLSTSGMQIGIGLLMALAVLATATGMRVVRHTPLDGLLGLTAGVFALSTIASGRPLHAPGWERLWVVVGYFGIYWWLDERMLPRVARALVFSGMFAAAYGIVQHFTGIDWYRELVGRPSPVRPRIVDASGFASVGFFRSYLTFAHVLVVPFGFALAGVGGRLVRVGLPVMAAALIFSTARGAWLAAAVMGVVYACASRRRRASAVLMLPLALALAWGVSPGLRTQVRAAFTRPANAGRLAIWRTNLDIIADRPVLGLGFGRYRNAARPYYARHRDADRRSHAHNNFLQIGAEAGLAGLAAFTLLFATLVRFGLEAARLARAPAVRAVATGGTLAIVGFLVGGLTQYTLGDSEVATAMWAAAALVLRARDAA